MSSLLCALAFLTFAGSPTEAQSPTVSAVPAERGPIETLLEMRSELGLSPRQVARLEQIDERLAEQNRPLVTRLKQLRRDFRSRSFGPPDQMTPAERERFEAYLAASRPLMRQIQRHNRAAMEEVGEVLTRAQKSRVAELLNKQEPSRERRGRLPQLPRRGS